MNKLQSFVAAIIVGSLAISAHAAPKSQYSKSQLEQFEATNKCSACDLSGAELSRNHSGAILDGANLSNIYSDLHDLPGINFSAANLQNANLSGADLEYANFSQADLAGARFDGADVSEANFYGAKNANLTNAYTCRATLPDGSRGQCVGKKSQA